VSENGKISRITDEIIFSKEIFMKIVIPDQIRHPKNSTNAMLNVQKFGKLTQNQENNPPKP
jgi:hypothetical protein